MKKLYAVRNVDGLFLGEVDSWGCVLLREKLNSHIVCKKYVHALDIVDMWGYSDPDDFVDPSKAPGRAKEIVEVAEESDGKESTYTVVKVVAEISEARAKAEIIRNFYRDPIHGEHTWALKMMLPDWEYPYHDSDEYWTPHNKEKAEEKRKYHKGNIFSGEV